MNTKLNIPISKIGEYQEALLLPFLILLLPFLAVVLVCRGIAKLASPFIRFN